MKNYDAYEIDDFIQDDDFRDWVQGHSSCEAFWLSFSQNYPHKQEALRQAERFIRAVSVRPERISDAEIRKEATLFIEKASAYIPNRKDFRMDSRSERNIWGINKSFRRRIGMATLLVVIIGIGWHFAVDSQSQVSPHLADSLSNHLVETVNNTPQPLRLLLNDSSEVILSPQSRLRYPSQFAKTARIVYLKGEASFSVRRKDQPFMVHTGEMVTKVLGTRFVIRAFDLDKKFTVQVISGKVSVYKAKAEYVSANKETSGLILHANQAAIFEKSDGNLIKTLVNNPSLVIKSVKESQFIYDEIALPVILRELEKSYGIPIQFDEQNFDACKITATLSNESLYEKLDLLCKAAAASYEITDGQIVISRKNFK